jgi:hypothetical protein
MSQGDAEQGAPAGRPRGGTPDRRPFTFTLDPALVERARLEVGERDMVRSIEAALTAAIDYQLWVREVTRGTRER